MNATLTDGSVPSARFVAFEHSVVVDLAPIVLWDVEDLHDADLDLVLGDRIADAYNAADVANALARLLGAPATTALEAHGLAVRAAELAG